MDGKQILALPMQQNDANAKTIGDYFKKLLRAIYSEGEGFSGKRPFGNSGWDHDIHAALVRGGAIKGRFDEDGWLSEFSRAAAEKAIKSAIAAMCETEPAAK